MKPSFYEILCLSLLICPFSLTRADDAARVVKYSPTDIIPIRAKVRFSTLIVLPADEEILDFTTGDKDFWIINGTHNLCYLHPAQAGIRSNMNLVTASGHVYSFTLTEISKDVCFGRLSFHQVLVDRRLVDACQGLIPCAGAAGQGSDHAQRGDDGELFHDVVLIVRFRLRQLYHFASPMVPVA